MGAWEQGKSKVQYTVRHIRSIIHYSCLGVLYNVMKHMPKAYRTIEKESWEGTDHPISCSLQESKVSI